MIRRLLEDLAHLGHVIAETLRRSWCRIYGHDWRGDGIDHPVIPPIVVCRRCGKFERLLTPRNP